MTQICPKCSYIRKATDTCPEWQCPACQVVYTKAGETLAIKPAGAANRNSGQNASSSRAWKWLILFAIAAGLAWQSQPAWKAKTKRGTVAGSNQAQGQPQVILYGTSWCGYCAAARQFFEANGIVYTELDVEKTTEGYQGHKKLGGGGVPLIAIGDQVMRGYNEAGLRELLAPWMRGN